MYCSVHSLLRIVGRIRKHSWVNTTPNTICAVNNEAVLVRVHELIIKHEFPCVLEELASTVRKELWRCGFARVMSDEILDVIRKLSQQISACKHHTIEDTHRGEIRDMMRSVCRRTSTLVF